MTKFKYQALKNGTEFIEGELEANNLKEARSIIRDLGFIPTKIYIEAVENFSNKVIKTKYKINHLSLSNKIQFTIELENMLSAGIPILEALQSIENNAPEPKIHKIAKCLKEEIANGKSFAQALKEQYGDTFGPVYTGLIKTGEDAGELEIALGRILAALHKQEDIKSRIINASIYPIILIVIMFGLLLLFSMKIFPVFMGFLNIAGQDLPFLAQKLYDICSFTNNYWWVVIISLAGLCGAIKLAFQNMQFKKLWDKFILKLPAVGEFIKYINLSNFLMILSISYDAGLPIMSGIELSNNAVENYTLKKQVEKANIMFKNGKPLSEALRLSSFLPSALTSLIATGEKSGKLGKMLKDTVNTIDKKLDIAIQTMVKMLEPTIILIMGGAVAFVAVAFYQMYTQVLGSLF